MGKPLTLLERFCGHVSSFDVQAFETERNDNHLQAFSQIDGARTRMANFPANGSEARQFRADLLAATSKPVRTVINGRVYIVQARAIPSLGEDAFEVRIDLAPRRDPALRPAFTPKQGQYLSFIHHYELVHRCAPAESDIQRYFRVSPPSVNAMVKTLERNGLLERTPGKGRSIRLLVAPEYLPPLG